MLVQRVKLPNALLHRLVCVPLERAMLWKNTEGGWSFILYIFLFVSFCCGKSLLGKSV